MLLSIFNLNPKSPEDFIWKNRILIIQNDEIDLSWFQENLRLDLKDRKLLIFQFEENKLVKTNCEHEINTVEFLEKLVSKTSTSYRWVLVGLDGGIKNSGKIKPEPEEIFKIIDAMPMRLSEIRRSGQ